MTTTRTGTACHILKFNGLGTTVTADSVLMNTVIEGGSAAGDGGSEKGGLVVACHDDHDPFFINGGGGIFGRVCSFGVAVVGVFRVVGLVEVAGELPVGAGEDEEGEGDQAQHGRQPSE